MLPARCTSALTIKRLPDSSNMYHVLNMDDSIKPLVQGARLWPCEVLDEQDGRWALVIKAVWLEAAAADRKVGGVTTRSWARLQQMH
jgi:hypothetical protein